MQCRRRANEIAREGCTDGPTQLGDERGDDSTMQQGGRVELNTIGTRPSKCNRELEAVESSGPCRNWADLAAGRLQLCDVFIRGSYVAGRRPRILPNNRGKRQPCMNGSSFPAR